MQNTKYMFYQSSLCYKQITYMKHINKSLKIHVYTKGVIRIRILKNRQHNGQNRHELTTSVVIGTDYTCSYKSNYHTITITTVPS